MTGHGFMFYNPNDFVGSMLETYGEWTYSEITLLSQLVNPGDVVVDVGANIGTHTLSLARQVLPGGFVYSLEPQRLAFEFLNANIVLNNLTNVFPIHAGAGDHMDSMLVPMVNPNVQANAAAFSIEGHSFGDRVRIITLDSLRLGRCTLIKVDVEGMECQVLEGARQTINNLRPILFLENNELEHSQRLLSLVNEFNYQSWWFFTEYPDRMVQPDFNVLCIPAERNHSIQGLEPVLGVDDTGPAAYTRATGLILKKES